MRMFAAVTVGSLFFVCSADDQDRRMTHRPIQQRYGIQNAYDGTTLHPNGHRSAAVPVTMADGRTGEFVIPSGNSDPHTLYYRDDQTGDFHPVRMNGNVTRQQVAQAPRAVRYQAEPQHSKKSSWEQ